MSRLPVRKTYKLYIGGAFPRSESGRTYESEGQNVARASRKDARDAVRAARTAFPAWSGLTAYNRGQVLYRLAEMMEARTTDLERVCSGRKEVEAAIDRLIWYAGWADKLAQVLGSSNPVAGPYFDFTVPEPTGVVAVVAPPEPPLGGLVSRLLPPLVGGNAVVVLASENHPLAAVELAEALATSDLPAGAVNILTGFVDEVAPWLAGHMDVNAIDLTGADGSVEELERLSADNVKRVVRSSPDAVSPWEIGAFLELKTVWHPIGLLSVPDDATPCPTCASILGATAPGGCIRETEHWFVDHCIGPLGVGTLIVKPRRHVVHVADLSRDEAAELGPLLQETAEVVTRLESPEQVYITLWSHMHAVPGHIHFVVQPVTASRMREHGDAHGARLQVEMFDRAVHPDAGEAAAFAHRARDAWASQPLVA